MKEYPIYNEGSDVNDPYLCSVLNGFPDLWSDFLKKHTYYYKDCNERVGGSVSLGVFLSDSNIESDQCWEQAEEIRRVVLQNYPQGEHKTMTVEFLEGVIEHVCGYKFEN